MRRQARVTRVAKMLLAGATLSEVAEQEGIGRTVASQLVNSSDCRHFLADLVDAEREEMRELFYITLRGIREASLARKEYCDKLAGIIKGGPDHYARLAAGKHFRELATIARPAPKPQEQKNKKLTLPEFEELVRQAEAARAQNK